MSLNTLLARPLSGTLLDGMEGVDQEPVRIQGHRPWFHSLPLAHVRFGVSPRNVRFTPKSGAPGLGSTLSPAKTCLHQSIANTARNRARSQG